MNAKNIFDVLAGITTVALVTTIVAHPATAGVINAMGGAYSSSISAALGKGTF